MAYFNYFKHIENKYRLQLSKQKPVIIRLDGKNITKNNSFNLMELNLYSTSLELLGNYYLERFSCSVYIAMDEINFIFYNPIEFFGVYEDTDVLYCANLFLQDCLKIVWDIGCQVQFGVSIFNIDKSKIDSYIKYRKSCCYNAAILYYAKRNIPKKYYVHKKLNDIIQYLKNQNLYHLLSDDFLFGIYLS